MAQRFLWVQYFFLNFKSANTRSGCVFQGPDMAKWCNSTYMLFQCFPIFHPLLLRVYLELHTPAPSWNTGFFLFPTGPVVHSIPVAMP